MKIGGKNISNWWLIGGGGGAVLLWFLYKRSASGSSSSAGQGTGTDPVTGLPYTQDQQVDPATGETYLQEAQQYGSVAAAEAAVSSGSAYSGYYGSGGGTGGYTGTAGYPTSNVTPGTSAGSTYATNAAWAQAVQAGLAGLGYDAQTVASALGAYFAGSPLTATQAQIIQTAEAEFGPPPQGTYNIVPEPSAGTGGAGSGGTTGTGPSGGPITAVPGNLRVTRVNGLQVSLAWDPVHVPAGQGPLAGYTVAYGQQPGNLPYELSTGPGSTTATITFSSGPGAHGLTHYFEVWARPASPGGPHAGPVSAKTQ